MRFDKQQFKFADREEWVNKTTVQHCSSRRSSWERTTVNTCKITLVHTFLTFALPSKIPGNAVFNWLDGESQFNVYRLFRMKRIPKHWNNVDAPTNQLSTQSVTTTSLGLYATFVHHPLQRRMMLNRGMVQTVNDLKIKLQRAYSKVRFP